MWSDFRRSVEVLAPFLIVLPFIAACGGGESGSQAEILHVPEQFSTIQAAVSASSAGDVILVAPGVYEENIKIAVHPVTIASHYYTTLDPENIESTVIDGGGVTAIEVFSVDAGAAIIGFTIRNGEDGISTDSELVISDNIITDNNDGIDFEGGGGQVLRNHIFSNNDDGVDLDGSSAPEIFENRIRANRDDGIEIRLHDHSSPKLYIDIHDNVISDNHRDGIQLIDYPGATAREFTISRNVISGNMLAGIGFMPDGNTVEDFSGASLTERVNVINNTIVGNSHGLTGGGNVIVINNVFAGNVVLAAKNVDGDSIIAYSLFWNNGTDFENCIIDNATLIFSDPRLGLDQAPLAGSPVIDAGVADYSFDGEVVLMLELDAYDGVAPDMGAVESR